MSTLIATNGNITNVNTGTIKDSTGNTTAMTVDSSGRVLMPARVCWMFTSSGGFTIAGASETAKVNWDTQVVNIGSAWNGSNREFTAPVAGTYRISWGMEFSKVVTTKSSGADVSSLKTRLPVTKARVPDFHALKPSSFGPCLS